MSSICRLQILLLFADSLIDHRHSSDYYHSKQQQDNAATKVENKTPPSPEIGIVSFLSASYWSVSPL